MIVQNLAVQRGQSQSFVVMLFARWRKQFALYPFKIYTELNKKCACVATSPVMLRWLCDSPGTGCARRTTPYIYVARTRNNRVIMACELYCCLLPQCEALRICRSGFPIATHVSMKPQRVIFAARGWEYFANDYLWTVFPRVLLWNPYAYSKKVESAKKFLIWEVKWNHVFFSKCFSKHSVKTHWWSCFCSG